MERLRELWRWLVTTRYTRMLEEEVSRLRGENRALVNSLLGTAGVSPIPDAEPTGPFPRVGRSRRMSRHQFQVFMERQAIERMKVKEPQA